MQPHAPFQPTTIINPPHYKQNSSFTSGTVPKYVPQNHQRQFNNVGLPYQYRPSSSSNGRPPLQNHTIAYIQHQPPMQQHQHLQVESNAVIEGVSQQNKRQQNFDQVRINYSREKQERGAKESAINSCPSSNTKRAVVQSLIFPGQETNRRLVQHKLQFYPKIATFPKNNLPKFDHVSQHVIPLNNPQQNVSREAKTDKNITGRKDHTLTPNMSIPNNLKYMRQSIGTEIKVNQYLSPPNSYKNINIQERMEGKNHIQVKEIHTMRKNMTQSTFWPMSDSPSQQRQAPNFWPMSHSPSEQNQSNYSQLTQQQSMSEKDEQKESDKKNQSAQVKKKNNFEFFKNIKKKRLSCFMQSQKQFQLSDFQLMDKLGKGAFGDVFIAQQKATGFICVIKKLLKKKLIQHKLQQQLLRQIKIQSYLNHRHLTSLYGFFNDEEYIYIILELLPDGSMMNVKKKRKMPQNEVSTYIRQISLGLKYMHTQSVIHRDIKPQNIFLYQGYAKIGDFGCSIYTNTYRNTQIGSLAYLSPEQLKLSTYNEKIDVWSLGVIAYEMLLGVSPFEKDIIKIARREMAPELSELKFPDKAVLSEQAKDFLIGVLDTDPERRFGIQEALRHQFILKYIKQDESKLQKIMG